MRIVILVEGRTEQAFKVALRSYLQRSLAGQMPALVFEPHHGRLPTHEKLKRVVKEHLYKSKNPADHVIALTDVYTGSNPPEFTDALHAKSQMRSWVGDEERFHPHAAQHDFEAWLLPYWPIILDLAGHNRAKPAAAPETVNHGNPPSHRIKKLFQDGTCRDSYVKPRDAARILADSDLSTAIEQCPELKALVNTILSVCGGQLIP